MGFSSFRAAPFRAESPSGEASLEAAFGDDGLASDLAKVAGLSVPLALYQQWVSLGSGRLALVAAITLAVSAGLSLAFVWLTTLVQTVDRDTPAVIMSFCTSSTLRLQLLLLSRFRDELPKQQADVPSGRVLQALGLTLRTTGRTATAQALNQVVTSVAQALLPALALSSVGLTSAFCSLLALAVGLTLSPALLVASPGLFGGGAEESAAEPSAGSGGASSGVSATATDASPFKETVKEIELDYSTLKSVWSQLKKLGDLAQRLAQGAVAAWDALSHPVRSLRSWLAAEFHRRLAQFVKGHRLLALGFVAVSCIAPGTGLLRLQLESDGAPSSALASRPSPSTPSLRPLVQLASGTAVAAGAPEVGHAVALSAWGIAALGVEPASLQQTATLQPAAPRAEDAVGARLPYVVIGMLAVLVSGNGIAYGSALHPLRTLLGVASTLLFALGLSSYTSGGGQDPDALLLSFFILAGISLAADVPLYARSRELRSSDVTNVEAVSGGFKDTSPHIVAAGVSTSASFAGLLLCRNPMLRGLGCTAVAGVLYDAFVSRCVLSPVSMSLLGRFNWWPSVLAPRSVKEAREAMDTEKHGKLQRVLEKRRVEVDEDRGEIRLARQVEFQKRHHGAESSAVFEDEAEALEILRDVAEVLDVYRTADLDIEGHTATPDDRLDDWSHGLALHRAEKVKSTLETLGVEPERLSAVGKPGKFGTGRSEVVLRITDV